MDLDETLNPKPSTLNPKPIKQIHLIMELDDRGIPFILLHSRLDFGGLQTPWRYTPSLPPTPSPCSALLDLSLSFSLSLTLYTYIYLLTYIHTYLSNIGNMHTYIHIHISQI
jgi:hypothetical protein